MTEGKNNFEQNAVRVLRIAAYVLPILIFLFCTIAIFDKYDDAWETLLMIVLAALYCCLLWAFFIFFIHIGENIMKSRELLEEMKDELQNNSNRVLKIVSDNVSKIRTLVDENINKN